jgi:hypothetical protein
MSSSPGWLPTNRLNGLSSFGSFYALLLGLSGLMVLFFVMQAVRFLPVTADNIYPESAGVLAAQRWAQGLPLYEDYRQPPYLMSSFTPLWYGVLVIASKAGLSRLDSLVLLGRFLSLASLLGMAVLAYLWNRRLGVSPRLSLLAPAFFLSLPILIPWAVTARPDFPSLFLALFALYWAGQRVNTSSVAVAAIAASLAFLMKQNTVAVAVALVLWLIWSRRWKHAALFCAVWGVVAAAMLLPFYRSDARLLLLNLSGAKFGFFALTYVRDIVNRMFARTGTGLAVALFALGTFGLLESLKERNPRVLLMSLYFLVGLLLAVVGTASAGGGMNHYLEPALAMAILIPAGMVRLEAVWQKDSPFAVFAMLVTAALIVPSLDVQRWNAMHREPENLRPFKTLMANKLAFSDDPYLAARSSTPQAIDLSSLTNSQKRGGWAAWSSAGLAEDLRHKKFQILVLRTRALHMPYDPSARYPRTHRLDSTVQLAVGQNYSLCFQSEESEDYGQLNVYGALPTQPNSSADPCPALRAAFLQQGSVRIAALEK